MTAKEFNLKYADYIEERFEGLEIDEPSIVNWLDSVFDELRFLPNFSFSQIKIKFGSARVYAKIGVALSSMIEDELTERYKRCLKSPTNVSQ